LFIRQAANLWQISELIQQRLVEAGGQRTANWQVLDTLPLPICQTVRATRSDFRGFEADSGYGAATREYYYGFKLGLRVSPFGMMVHYPLLQARPQDVVFLEDLVGDFRGDVVADKGFLDQWRQPQLAYQGVFLQTPTRRNLKTSNGWNNTFAHFRKLVETVASKLTQQFGLQPLKLRSFWHLRHRLIRKVLSHIICIFYNLQLHRPPLEMADLVNESMTTY
jgi:hypothetical protein